jgi:L-asparaginase II
MVESIHRGDVVVIDHSGEIIKSYGNPMKRTYWRSAAKPFQVLPFVEEGGLEHFNIETHELALMCASHGGEEKHVQDVSRLLGKLGLDPSYLDCGKSRPMYEGAYRKLLASGQPFTQLHNPCSGKHSGMLALGKLRDIDLHNYIDRNHPIQKQKVTTISEVARIPKEEIEIAIDGCGVPVFGLPIYNMALAYSQLANPSERIHLKEIASAMTHHPFHVAGTRRLDTIIMEETKGRVVAKLGAEAVYCVGLIGEGKALALKIEDGAYRALDPLVPWLLETHGFIDHQDRMRIEARLNLEILNHRKEVIGDFRVVCE